MSTASLSQCGPMHFQLWEQRRSTSPISDTQTLNIITGYFLLSSNLHFPWHPYTLWCIVMLWIKVIYSLLLRKLKRCRKVTRHLNKRLLGDRQQWSGMGELVLRWVRSSQWEDRGIPAAEAAASSAEVWMTNPLCSPASESSQACSPLPSLVSVRYVFYMS